MSSDTAAGTRARLRVLYLTSGMPFPPHSGGQLREFQQITRLSRTTDIHLRVLAPAAEVDPAGRRAMKRWCASVRRFEPDPEPAAGAAAAVPERMRRHRSALLRRDLRDLLGGGQVDAVHVQGYFLAQHVPGASRAPLLLFEENIEYQLDRQRAETGLAAADEPRWTVTRRHEHAAWRRADLCVVPSEEMRRLMLADLPGLAVKVSPNGWDHLDRPGRHPRRPGQGWRPRVGFLGNYSWPPSEDAAVFLLERLWPAIRARVGTAELVLVGATPSPRMLGLAARHEGVTVTGTLPSVGPLLAATDVFLCPLRVGGGVKMKMVEALACGCAVVSTTVGAQGLPAAVRDLVVVADAPERLVEATVALLEDPPARRALGRRAEAAVRGLPSWDDIAEQVGRYWRELALDGERQPLES